MPRFLATTLVAALGTACGADCPSSDGLRVAFDPALAERASEAETWLSYPYPSDHRRTQTGSPRLTELPNPSGSEVVREYTRHGELVLDGFGTNEAVYVLFESALDTSRLSTSPVTFASATSPIQLIDVTPTSPEYGVRRPLVWQYWDAPGKYVAQETLAVAPAWGFPLRERTTYALILTTELEGEDGRKLVQDPLAGWLAGDLEESCVSEAVGSSIRHELSNDFAPLRERLATERFDQARVAAATVFTTQGITAQLAAIWNTINRELPAPAYRDDGWQQMGGAGGYHSPSSFQWNSTEAVDYSVLEGRYYAPNFQHGTLPYAAARDGGAFAFVDGVPQVARTEDLRFVLTVPSSPPPDNGACYPVVLYAHGTGGSAYSFVGQTGGRLAARGLATIGIDQPLHGLRAEGKAFQVDLMTFNYFNPYSVRANFRQAAADTFSLVRFVRESLYVPASKSPTGDDICFDPARVFFFGHSQGGLTGSMAAAIEPDIDTWVLSGAGGGLAVTMLERKDFLDIEALLRTLLWMDEQDEPLSELHPIIRLIQTLGDITDPLNYSPYWAGLEGRSPPHSLLVTSGEHDEATPHRTATALAVAARIPVVAPVVIPIPQYGWAAISPVDAPVSENIGDDTAGFLQWTNDIPGANYDSHFVVFYRPEAINASMRFLESAAYESSRVIERVVDADVR